MEDVVYRINEGYRSWRALRTEAWGMRNAERRKVDVLEMKCLRSLVGVSRSDIVLGMKRRAGIERELRVEQIGDLICLV